MSSGVFAGLKGIGMYLNSGVPTPALRYASVFAGKLVKPLFAFWNNKRLQITALDPSLQSGILVWP